MITVRQASPVDADVLATLNQAFNAVGRDGERIRDSLQANASTETVLVAEEAGVVNGVHVPPDFAVDLLRCAMGRDHRALRGADSSRAGRRARARRCLTR